MDAHHPSSRQRRANAQDAAPRIWTATWGVDSKIPHTTITDAQTFALSCAASGRQLMLPYDAVVATLTAVGDHLADAVHSSQEPRAQSAVAHWQQRDARLRADASNLHSGLDSSAMTRLIGDQAPESFWEIDPADPAADTVILAAARMSAGYVDGDTQRHLLDRLRAIPKAETTVLDDLAASVATEVAETGRPFEQGYRLAIWLRDRLGLGPSAPCAPVALLQAWGVIIESMDIPDSPIEAIAASSV